MPVCTVSLVEVYSNGWQNRQAAKAYAEDVGASVFPEQDQGQVNAAVAKAAAAVEAVAASSPAGVDHGRALSTACATAREKLQHVSNAARELD